MNKEEYNYWLANIHNIGARKIGCLLRVFGTAEEIFKASKMELMERLTLAETELHFARISETDLITLINSRNPEEIRRNHAKLKEGGILFVTKQDKEYPDRLRQIFDAPYALYVKGRLPDKDKKYLAVVGARDCSSYGREMARHLAGAVAREGIAVISGLARGIDAHAHEGALKSGGISYGVLGCGIDICYPRENMNLYMEMQKEGGIISEYPAGTLPYSGNFPMRNRIISGLSDAILVIEAREKSGSLITADMGLDQGRDIFALPGRATDRLSDGCNNLIKMGAKLVTTPKDILEELLPNYEQNMDENKINYKLLETDGKIVYSCLSLEPRHIEELAALSKLPMERLTEQLIKLELYGLIRQSMRNYYVIQADT